MPIPASLTLHRKDQGCIITAEHQQPAFSSILFCSPGLDIIEKPYTTIFYISLSREHTHIEKKQPTA